MISIALLPFVTILFFSHTRSAVHQNLGLINAEHVMCVIFVERRGDVKLTTTTHSQRWASTLCSFFYGTVLAHKLNALLTAAALAAF